MTTKTFECSFKLSDGNMTVRISTNENIMGMYVFTNGFWLDEDLNLVHDEQENYRERQYIWVPPHRIQYIRREEVAEEEDEDLPAA